MFMRRAATRGAYTRFASSTSSTFTARVAARPVAALLLGVVATGSAVTAFNVACAEKPEGGRQEQSYTAKEAPKSKQGGKKKPPFDLPAVRKEIEDMLDDDLGRAPILLRLAWHAAGNWDAKANDGMSNTASMRFEPECKYAANAGLDKARDMLEPIKKRHPKITYADLWVLAGCIAVEAMGGPPITFRWGREDSFESSAPDLRLPDASKSHGHVREVFSRMGFNDQETVALLGAHAVGECHKKNSGFDGPWTHDKLGFTNTLFTTLKENEWLVDKRKPLLQYTDLATRTLMMLPTDVCLLYDKSFNKWVDAYAEDDELFKRDFAKAFQKLVELGCKDKLFDA
jgi:catalase (peroxidase I)